MLTLVLLMVPFSAVTIGCLHWYQQRILQEKKIKQRPKPLFAPSDPDVVIIGGGIAGCATAIRLARDGREVVLIERNMSPPDTIRGEGFLPGARKALEDLGLQDILEDHKDSYALNGLVFTDFSTDVEAVITFPRPGVAGHHGSLVNALRICAKLENRIRIIEGVAKGLIKEYDRVVGVKYRLKEDKAACETKVIRAALTMICDGSYSSLRKFMPHSRECVKESCLLGVELEKISFPYPNYVHIGMGMNIPERLAYVTFQLSENTTRMNAMFQKKPNENAVNLLKTRVAPALPKYLREPYLRALEKSNPHVTVQCYRRPPNFDTTLGVQVIGDAMSSRDPVVASGMTVALNDVKFWTNKLRRLSNLCDDEFMLRYKAEFKMLRKTYSYAIDITSHFISYVFNNPDNAAVKLQQAWIRRLNKLEKEETPKEIRNKAYTKFALLDLDADEAKEEFNAVCRDAMAYSFTSRPWVAFPNAAWESLTILYTFRQIMNIEALDLDPDEAKEEFIAVCRDAMAHSFSSRPWTAFPRAAWESLTILYKFRQIMDIEA